MREAILEYEGIIKANIRTTSMSNIISAKVLLEELELQMMNVIN